MAGQWTVFLEAAGDGANGGIEGDDVAELLRALDGGANGGFLHSPDRYALQLTTTAANPAEALSGVFFSWADAVRQLGLPCWEVVRAEVLTLEELERDYEVCQRDRAPLDGSSITRTKR